MILGKETGMRIKELMLANKISVREVQERLGLESAQAVYKWLHGASLPALDNLLVLSRILGVRMEDILVCTETCGYPLGIRDDALGVPGEWKDKALASGERGGDLWQEESTGWRERKRQVRPIRLSDFPDLQTVLRWNLQMRLAGERRRRILYPWRRAERDAGLYERRGRCARC